MKEINLKNIITVENIGSGIGVYSDKTNGNNLQFKSISATGTSIQIINTANQIYISGATGGGTGLTYVCVDGQNNMTTCISPLTNVTTGFDNIAIGYLALSANATGAENVSMGTQSLFCNTTGSYNVAISECALFNNKTGQNNIAIGDFAIYSNTGGTCNIGIGLEALYSNTSGNGNISIGVDNLNNSVSGCDNIALGNLSANALITGSNNTFIGKYAGNNETGSNKLHIGSIINKSLIYGEFDNEKLCVRGQTYMSGLTNGCNSNLIYYNSSTKELTYGISCYLPLTGGTVSGCITAVNFILGSDCRLKENIRPITISEIDRVSMVEFNYISDDTKHLRYGVLAQDLEKIHPEMVYENKEGFKEVAYIDYLVAKINSLEKRINILELKLI